MSHYGGTGGELIKHSTVATSEIKKTRSFGQETEVLPCRYGLQKDRAMVVRELQM